MSDLAQALITLILSGALAATVILASNAMRERAEHQHRLKEVDTIIQQMESDEDGITVIQINRNSKTYIPPKERQ